MPRGYKKDGTFAGRVFQKGHHSKTEFKKGNHPKTEFKKDYKMSEKIKAKISKTAKEKGIGKWMTGKKHSEETKRKMSVIQKNTPHKRKILHNGYYLILKPNHPFCECKGYVREHRLVIESQIGRYLIPSETTHHPGERDDNRLHMLMAFVSNSAHRRFHGNPDNVKPEEIIFDGRFHL